MIVPDIEAAVARLSEIIIERTGIAIHTRQRASLQRYLQARPVTDMDLFLAELATQPMHTDHMRALLEIVINGETYFFRDRGQWQEIGRHIAAAAPSSRAMRVWSAACSSGEEPYTMAMVAAKANVDVEILATDINPHLLERARLAAYDDWALRRIEPVEREQFFRQRGGRYEVVETIRRQVTFENHNLMDTSPSRATGFDIILCRNVLIYFAPQTVTKVACKLLESLAPKGILFLAAGETLFGMDVPAHPRQLGRSFAYVFGPRHERQQPPGLQETPSMPATATPMEPAPSSQSQPVQSRSRTPRASRTTIHTPESVTPASPDPVIARNLYESALEQRRLDNLDRHEELLKQTLFLVPRFWPAAFLLARVYRDSGRMPQARRAYRRVLHLMEESGIDAALAEIAMDPEDASLYATEVKEVCSRFLSSPDVS